MSRIPPARFRARGKVSQLLPQAFRRPSQEELDARRPHEQEVAVARGAREQHVVLQPPVVAFLPAVAHLVAAA
eukprot:4693074-Pyramimonas_sp.AAC.1